jgi:hypothetical protein
VGCTSWREIGLMSDIMGGKERKGKSGKLEPKAKAGKVES